MTAAYEAIYAPLDGWLVMLAQGWQLDGPVVEPMGHNHGAYSILLVRPCDG